MKMAVAKFGGTSTTDANVILQSAAVVKERKEIRLVVISATAGTTNQLFAMAKDAAFGGLANWQSCLATFERFQERHLKMARELQASPETIAQIDGYIERVKAILQGMNLLREASLSASDDLVSHGELISSVLFCQALRRQALDPMWLDAREIMKTSSDFGRAIPQTDLLRQKAFEQIAPHWKNKVIVTQGYIGSDLQGRTTTLGKEGSDYSTALFAEALDASEVQIWKDVAGVMTTDPRVVSSARTLSEITFSEVAELTRFGAKVIHPDTFLPVIRKNIPVYVGHSQNPLSQGTRIQARTESLPDLRALAIKRELKLLNLGEIASTPSPDFHIRQLTILSRYKISALLMSSSENRLCLVLDKLQPLSADVLRELAQESTVTLHENKELIALIGHGIKHKAKLQAMALTFADGCDIDFISAGPSEHAFSFLVEAEKANTIVNAIHQNILEYA